MADWGGIISGALQGGAKAVGNLAQGYIEDERRLDYAKQISDMEMEKQRRLEEFRTQNRYEDDVRRSDVNGQLYKNNMQAKRDETDLQTEAQKTRDQNRVNIAAEDERNFGKDPERVNSVKKRAQAQHIAGPGDVLQQYRLEQERKIGALRGELAKTTDPTVRDRIQSQIADLTGNSKSRKDLLDQISRLKQGESQALSRLGELEKLPEGERSPGAIEQARAAATEYRSTIQAMMKEAGLPVEPMVPRPAGKPSGVDLRQFDANPSKRGATSGF